jgi:hypothetical protein
MGRGQAFVDLLDGMLDGYESHAAAAPRRPLPIATRSHYWIPQALQRGHASAAPARLAEAPAQARPRRTLSMKQQDALDTLLGLGARLDQDFTDGELRRAFRNLALRYHPDRHVDAGEAERARLAALFARARAAYELLLMAAAPPTLH